MEGADPVIWYSFGVTHAPRVEDFPVMPVEITGETDAGILTGSSRTGSRFKPAGAAGPARMLGCCIYRQIGVWVGDKRWAGMGCEWRQAILMRQAVGGQCC